MDDLDFAIPSDYDELMDTGVETQSLETEVTPNQDDNSVVNQQEHNEPNQDDENEETTIPSGDSITIKYNGEDIELSQEEAITLAQKGMFADNKLDENREMLNILDGYGVKTIEDFNALIQSGVQVEEKDVSYEVNKLANDIMSNDNAGAFQDYMNVLPDTFVNELQGSTELLGGLYEDFNSGVAQQALPNTQKLMAMDSNLGFVDAYRMAGKQLGLLGEQKDSSKVSNPKGGYQSFNMDMDNKNDMTDEEYAHLDKLIG